MHYVAYIRDDYRVWPVGPVSLSTLPKSVHIYQLDIIYIIHYNLWLHIYNAILRHVYVFSQKS